MKAKEITIKGKVHDVGYRLFLLSEAESVFIEKFDARNVIQTVLYGLPACEDNRYLGGHA